MVINRLGILGTCHVEHCLSVQIKWWVAKSWLFSLHSSLPLYSDMIRSPDPFKRKERTEFRSHCRHFDMCGTMPTRIRAHVSSGFRPTFLAVSMRDGRLTVIESLSGLVSGLDRGVLDELTNISVLCLAFDSLSYLGPQCLECRYRYGHARARVFGMYLSVLPGHFSPTMTACQVYLLRDTCTCVGPKLSSFLGVESWTELTSCCATVQVIKDVSVLVRLTLIGILVSARDSRKATCS